MSGLFCNGHFWILGSHFYISTGCPWIKWELATYRSLGYDNDDEDCGIIWTSWRVITDCFHLTPIESLVPIEGHLSYPEGLVFIHGLHLFPIDGLVCSESCLGSTATLAYTGALHLIPMESLIPTDGHLASTEALVITEGLHLTILIGDCPLVFINNCYLTISDKCHWGVSDIHQLVCSYRVSLIKGGHLGVKKKVTLGFQEQIKVLTRFVISFGQGLFRCENMHKSSLWASKDSLPGSAWTAFGWPYHGQSEAHRALILVQLGFLPQVSHWSPEETPQCPQVSYKSWKPLCWCLITELDLPLWVSAKKLEVQISYPVQILIPYTQHHCLAKSLQLPLNWPLWIWSWLHPVCPPPHTHRVIFQKWKHFLCISYLLVEVGI